jgi:4-amino-4-deoxy-L-arabinose transferase-like glycosyltransferase
MNQTEEIPSIKTRVNPKIKWGAIILFALVAYFPLFLHLGSFPLKNFDESLFAIRAYKMAHYGEYLYNFRDLPDGPSSTNVKPTFFTTIQALSYKIIGYNELALRIPVALCVVLLLFYFLRFSKQETGSYLFGFFCGMVLLTSIGFIRVHVARTGDHDAPLAVFGWLSLLYFFKYLQNDRQSSRDLWIFTFFLIAGTLTKSVSGLFFCPAMLLYSLYKKQFVALLKTRDFWLAIAAFVISVGSFYVIREIEHPGFWKFIVKGELGGRYLGTLNGHNFPWYWYAVRLYKIKFMPWLLLLPVGIGLMITDKNRRLADFGVLMTLAGITWMTVISTAQTKLEWYDASLYPVMAMLVGYVLYRAYQLVMSYVPIKSNALRSGLTVLIFILVFAFPYKKIIEKVYQPKDIDYPGERYGLLISQVKNKYPDLKEFTIQYNSFSTHILFYQLVYNQHRGYHISRIDKPEEARVGMTVMSCDPNDVKYLEENFVVEPITGKEGCKLLRLLELRAD